MITHNGIDLRNAALAGWETRRRRKAACAKVRKSPLPRADPHRDILTRLDSLDASRAEHYALLRALEERIEVIREN